MYSYLLFDLDGTLTDSSEGIINSIRYALSKQNITVINDEELKEFIGPPLSESFETIYALTGQENQLAIADYRTYYTQKGMYENKIYPGIIDLLDQLKQKNKQLYIATSKPEIFAKKILDHFDLSKYFSGIYGASLDGVRSNKADVISYAFANSGIKDVKNSIMIGDRKHDIDGAKKNGIDSLGVLYGFGKKSELEAARAIYLCYKPAEILSIII